jgi:hypothetical protein
MDQNFETAARNRITHPKPFFNAQALFISDEGV